MILADLRDGDRVFIDANIFLYHFGGRSLECKALLERCARRTLLGYTSTPLLLGMLVVGHGNQAEDLYRNLSDQLFDGEAESGPHCRRASAHYSGLVV